MSILDELRLQPWLGFSKGLGDAGRKNKLINGTVKVKPKPASAAKKAEKEELCKKELESEQVALQGLQNLQDKGVNVGAKKMAKQEKAVASAQAKHFKAYLAHLNSMPLKELKDYVKQAKDEMDADPQDTDKKNTYGDAYRQYLRSITLEDLRQKFDAIGLKKPPSIEQEIYAERLKGLGDNASRNNMLGPTKDYYTQVQPVALDANKTEIWSMLNVTLPPLLRWNVSIEQLPVKNITVTEQVPEVFYKDMPGCLNNLDDGYDRPWGDTHYGVGNSSATPVYVDKTVYRASKNDSFNLSSPSLKLGGEWSTFRIGGSYSSVDPGDTANSYFYLWPYVNKDTPSYISDHSGEKLVATAFGKTETCNLNAETSVYLAPIMGDNILSLLMVPLNKVNFRYDGTWNRKKITAYPNYEYKEKEDKFVSNEVCREFSTLLNSVTGSGESQTFSLLFQWPYTFYTAFFYSAKYSWLSSRSATDQYIFNDESYVSPTYFMDNKLTDEDRANDGVSHAAYTAARKLARDKVLSAKEYTLGIRSSFPGMFQWLHLLGCADIQNGHEKNVGVNMLWKWTVDDTLTKTGGDGSNPSTIDNYNGYVKYKKGDANHNNFQDPGETWERDADGNWVMDPAYKVRTDDYHADIEPYNSFSWHIQYEYDFRVGYLTRLKTPWNSDYGHFWNKNFWPKHWGIVTKTIPRILGEVLTLPFWAAKSAYSVVPEKLFGIHMDTGMESDVPIYVPLEFSCGVESFSANDINTGEKHDYTGHSKSVGVGLGIGENFRIMYRWSSSNNGYNYSDESRSVVATYKF